LSSIASIFPRLAIPPILNFDYQCIVWQLHEMTGGTHKEKLYWRLCGTLWCFVACHGVLWHKKSP